MPKQRYIAARVRVYLSPDRAWKIPAFAQRWYLGQADVARMAIAGNGLNALFVEHGELDLLDEETLIEQKRQVMNAIQDGKLMGKQPPPRVLEVAGRLGVPVPANWSPMRLPKDQAREYGIHVIPHITTEQALQGPGWKPGDTTPVPSPEDRQARYLMIGMPPELAAAVEDLAALAAGLREARFLQKSQAGILMTMIEQGRERVTARYQTEADLEKAASAARRKELRKSIKAARERGWPLPPELEAEAGRLGLLYEPTELAILEKR